MPPISIRQARTHEEYAACEELSRSIWGESERNVVPRELLLTMQLNGGLVQGAWLPDGTMVGFVFGFLGTRHGHLRLCSHQLGVLPAYRGLGLGVQLKLAQAEEAKRRGLDLITWTFDPLEARNAYINIHRLGAIARTYDRDHYGVMQDELNRGLSSDRFEAEEWLGPAAARWPRPSESAFNFAPLALGVGSDDEPLLTPVRLAEARQVLVEVPTDFQALKRRSLEQARRWRQASRQVLEAAIAHGFYAVDFLRRGAYVLVRK
jgi:predicted GNAT superfamily acetyltransferase